MRKCLVGFSFPLCLVWPLFLSSEAPSAALISNNRTTCIWGEMTCWNQTQVEALSSPALYLYIQIRSCKDPVLPRLPLPLYLTQPFNSQNQTRPDLKTNRLKRLHLATTLPPFGRQLHLSATPSYPFLLRGGNFAHERQLFQNHLFNQLGWIKDPTPGKIDSSLTLFFYHTDLTWSP